MVSAGFVGFEITGRADVFKDAPLQSGAASVGTLGINFRAKRPRTQEEWEAAITALSCEVPPSPF